MIIDTSYFYGDLAIAQINQPAVLSSLNSMIAVYERKFLNELLGYELGNDFQAGLLVDPIDPIWSNLLSGAEYTNWMGSLDKWGGLKRLVVGSQYQSPIANYVYYWWLRNNASTTAGGGEAANSVSVSVSPADKQRRAWNEMVQWNQELIYFLYSNNLTYPGFDISNYLFDNYWFYSRNWFFRTPAMRNQQNLLTAINPVGF